MAKGGGGKPSPFNLNWSGVYTMSSSEAWLSLATIPSGQQYQFGYLIFTPLEDTITCEFRSNLAGQSAGTVGATVLHAKASGRAGSEATADMWRRGRLYIVSVVSTGVEQVWLRFTCRRSTTTEIIYNVGYLELN